jgi:type IV pilus assembly protein PilY1
VSVPADASESGGAGTETPFKTSNAPPAVPMAVGGSTPPPGASEAKNRRLRPRDHGAPHEMATFEYFYDTSDNRLSASRCSSAGNSTYENCFDGTNENDFDWRARSSDLNVLFFNPDTTYVPWVDFADASFTSARSQPVSSLDGYTDTFNLSGFFYHYWIDDKGYTGSQPNGSNVIDGANGVIDQWDSHVKVTVSTLSFSCDLFTYRPDGIDLNLLITPLSSSDPLCLAALGRNPSLDDLQVNVANWYQYYRKRILVSKAAVTAVVTEKPEFRYGLSLINDSSTFVEMPDANITDYTDHNAQMIATYQNTALGLYTPLRRGLERVGNYYAGTLSGKTSPIIEACQKNFSILFTDGFWNQGDPNNPSNDFDGDGGTIGSENILLADVAKYFYDTDLAGQFDDVVPNDDWDTAMHQHMVTYTIGFGITGRLSDTDADGWPNDFNPYSHTGPWYLAGSSDDQKKVDDLWHSAWNGRGAYYSARRPEQLVRALGAAIQDIADRSGSSASAAANSGSLSEQSQIFQSIYDTSDWHGELLAFPVDSSSGDLNAVSWEAGALLNAQSEAFFANSRQIFTWKSDINTGTTFTWSGLNLAQQTELSKDPVTGDVDTEGEARLQYIRGSAVNEGQGNEYRVRTNKLGDLIHSGLQYVAESPFFYSFDDHRTFSLAQVNRKEMIYVGGNDGMLHAFRTDTGAELFAYVPNDLMPKLNQLTSVDYAHEFYVDGPMDYGDVYMDNAGVWKSVLAGSLRSGGQAVYALDITDPTNFSASNVLWEFTDENDPDLGFVMGKPQIKKMANGKWAVIVTSGYNNTEVDGAASSSGDSFVFILYIEAGKDGWSSGDYVKIPVLGADGLSEPAVADVDGDSLADFIYVGDIDGNMWKIDVTSTSSSSWGVALSGNPLFTATESSANGGSAQAITSRPAIKTHPLGIQEGVLVLWGTGKYYELSDDSTTDQPVQSVYSVWDRDGYYNRALNARTTDITSSDWGFSRETQLVSPEIIVDTATNTRIIDPDSLIGADGKPNTPVWYDASGNPVDRGWVVDLPEAGERVVQQIILRDDLAFFVTLIPEENVCVPGSTGWLMVLNAETGNAPQFPVFDINNDNIIDSSDVLTVGATPNTTKTQVSGVAMQSMPSLPVFLYDDRPEDFGDVFPPSPNSARSCGSAGARAFTYTTQADGSLTKITTSPQPLACGRQNWIQTE